MQTVLRLFAWNEPSEQRAVWFVRLWAVFGLLLIGATWRLWTPQTVFPQVPLVRWAGLAPDWLHWVGLSGLVGSLIAVLALRPDAPRRAADHPVVDFGVFLTKGLHLLAVDDPQLDRAQCEP